MLLMPQGLRSFDNKPHGRTPSTSRVNLNLGHPWVISSIIVSPWTKLPPFRRRHFQKHFHEWKVLYIIGKCCYTPEWGTLLVIIHILSACMWDLKASWLAGFLVFVCIVYIILFNVYFGKFVMTFIDIGEIDCMSLHKGNWMVIVVNLVKQTFNFLHDAACWRGFVYAGSYRVFPPLAAITTPKRRGMLATRHCRRSTWISAHSSSRAWRICP